jgi:hypothetical protein
MLAKVSATRIAVSPSASLKNQNQPASSVIVVARP